MKLELTPLLELLSQSFSSDSASLMGLVVATGYNAPEAVKNGQVSKVEHSDQTIPAFWPPSGSVNYLMRKKLLQIKI